MSFLTALVFLFLSGCQSGSGVSGACRDYCDDTPENYQNSVTIPGDIRCHDMIMEALEKGQKQGYCYVGYLTISEGAKHPDPDKCNALKHTAEQKCKLLPPDPSMMNKTVSGTSIYDGDKLVMVNGQPVINGKPCTCD